MGNESTYKSVASLFSRKWWLLRIHYAFFIIQYSFGFAQTPTREQLIGTWVGVHREMDTDFFCPLPSYIQLDADSTYHLGLIDRSAVEHVSTWSLKGEQVRLDTILFSPGLVSLTNDVLRFGTNYPMVFRRFTDTPTDSIQVYQQLAGRVWQSDSLALYVYTDGKAALENTRTKERTVHFWKLSRLGKSTFLILQGNQYHQDDRHKAIWQISRMTSRQLQLIGWKVHQVSAQDFRFVRTIDPGDSCRPSGFQTCDNCFRKEWYDLSMARGHSRYDILQTFFKHYQPVVLRGESGIVSVQFVINCGDERGLFTVKSVDEAYCPKVFDTRITNQLLSICRHDVVVDPELRRPPIAGASLEDATISLSFRFKDGRLTEILP